MPGSCLVNQTSRSQYPADADQHPEEIEDRVGEILFEDDAPGKQDRVNRVENPNEQERAGWAKPTYETETEYAHEDADEFDVADVF